MMKILFLFIGFTAFGCSIFAQDMHMLPAMQMDSSMRDMDMGTMSSGYSRNLSMSRDGSGTSWLPDQAPMRAISFQTGKWQMMTDFNIFLRYTNQDVFRSGSRGGAKFDAPNMGMLMGQHRLGSKGLFHFGFMASLDPLTEQGYGYPLLFQTGESWKGKPLIDRQHPHDLISELAASYSWSFSRNNDLFLYLGYPGEPALGPVTFMHRPGGMADPDAPIGHHWQDATHITFGVATLGYRYSDLRLEASSFTGREPDENRYNFDKPRFDSYSARLSYNPGVNWALQVSSAYIKSPEALRPLENVTRSTASATYANSISPGESINADLVFGLNQTKGTPTSPSALLEGALNLGSSILYMRYEWVEKSTEELVLNETTYGNRVFSINLLSLGINQKIYSLGKMQVFAGAQVNLYDSPAALANLYGKNPVGGEVFLRICPSIMKM